MSTFKALRKRIFEVGVKDLKNEIDQFIRSVKRIEERTEIGGKK